MKIPQYPNDFFDFSDGSDVNNETINKWIKDIIDELESDQSVSYSSRSTGNTSVQIGRGEHEKYEITVIKQYGTAKIYNK